MKLTIKQLRRLIKEAVTAANLDSLEPGATGDARRSSLGEFLDKNLRNMAYSGDMGPHVGGSGSLVRHIRNYFLVHQDDPEGFIFKKHDNSSFDPRQGPTVGQFIDNKLFGMQDLAVSDYEGLQDEAMTAFQEYSASRRGRSLFYGV
jgi:hypothetical protein